ncbi:MAG: fibronectin type III domain-containing protein [Desulfobacteraceae bacterium]
MKPSALIAVAVFIFLCAGPVFVSGCGKKGPPRPPEGESIAPPTGLTYEIKENTAHLRWKTQDDSNAGQFEIFKAEQPVEGCNGCPVKFEMIRKVPADQTSFAYELSRGTRYYFRVRSVESGDRTSDYSNTVRFEH